MGCSPKSEKRQRKDNIVLCSVCSGQLICDPDTGEEVCGSCRIITKEREEQAASKSIKKPKGLFVATGHNSIEVASNPIIVEYVSDMSSSNGCPQILYPWDLLRIMNSALESKIQTKCISSNATVSDRSIIRGPCLIEDGVYIDDFCKILGPTYIGKNSNIGTGSLIRNCMIGAESNIGFNCEIGRSYLAGNNAIPHHNVILDSIVGQNTWMGGYVGTTNFLLNKQNIRFKLGDRLVDTGVTHFGAVIGPDCAIGAGVLTLPGRFIPSNSQIQPGIVVS
jgi:acetyltransferase-like isoleucine patch superfamily enzyme